MSWSSPPLPLDQGNSNDAWQPAVAVEQSNGVVTVAWYDVRDDAGSKLYRVYYTESWDGGNTFFPQQIAASTTLADATANCLGTGDYMQVVAMDGVAHPVWSDGTNAMTAAVHEGHFGSCWTTVSASGNQAALVVNTDGTVSAWGYNSSGQLGDGTTTSRSSPVTVVGSAGIGTTLQGIESVAMANGGAHSLALRQSDGSVWSWGSNNNGQLGVGGTSDTKAHPVPREVVGQNGTGFLTGVLAIAAAGSDSYALKSA